MNHPVKKLSMPDMIYLVSTKKEDITLSKLKEFFAFSKDGPPRYNPSDTFILKANALYNDSEIKTTAGRYIFNKVILDDNVGSLIGYMNDTFDGDRVGDLDGQLSQLLLKDKITTKEFSDYIDKIQWIGFAISGFINSSLTTEMIIAPDKVKQRKEELLMKYEKELDEGSLDAISKIEKELLKLSKEELKGLADLDIYDSGSRGSFGNNYKLQDIIRGGNKNFANPSEVRISKSNLEDGIDPDEL